jgi:hypothetical protein
VTLTAEQRAMLEQMAEAAGPMKWYRLLTHFDAIPAAIEAGLIADAGIDAYGWTRLEITEAGLAALVGER